jgi:hypothetical protein
VDGEGNVLSKHQIPFEHLLAPIEIIAYHTASAQLGLAIWWLENSKPYPRPKFPSGSV